MPSAAAVKVEKPEAQAPESPGTGPLKQAMVILEHKIRNMEKRKSKLESYRDLQRSGKELNGDQKTAVAHYDEVVNTLEFARDMHKQILTIAASSEKEAKKLARKEASLRNQAEVVRIKEILGVQDILAQQKQDVVREDLLLGRNGAPLIPENELKCLSDLSIAVVPKHVLGEPSVYSSDLQSAAEHLQGIVEGKNKEVFGCTYAQVKDTVQKIQQSGYLDRTQDCREVPLEPAGQEPLVNNVAPLEPIQQIEMEAPPLVQEALLPPNSLDNSPPVLPPPQQQPNQQPIMENNQNSIVPPPNMVEPPLMENGPNQMPKNMYYQPQPPQRQITDVIGAGNFFFLQESELDTPPEIPTQTFTNQSFSGGPPPPIPMPPAFQVYGSQMPPEMGPPNGPSVIKQMPQDEPNRPYPPNSHYNQTNRAPSSNRNGRAPNGRQ